MNERAAHVYGRYTWTGQETNEHVTAQVDDRNWMVCGQHINPERRQTDKPGGCPGAEVETTPKSPQAIA